jgi:16S rRNA processing protein RimM
MTDADAWISIAQLGRARGIRGEITGYSLSSKPERFARLKTVRLIADPPAVPATYEVEEVWAHNDALVFKFAGIDTMTDAEKLRGFEVQIPRSERVQLEPGEYFHSDLIGCEVRDRASGRIVGKVTSFEEYGGPPLLEIDKGKLLIPFVKAICVDIRPEERLILADIPEGLEDLERK